MTLFHCTFPHNESNRKNERDIEIKVYEKVYRRG